jgi:hypothetical protein
MNIKAAMLVAYNNLRRRRRMNLCKLERAMEMRQAAHEALCDELDEHLEDHFDGKSTRKMAMKLIRTFRKDELVMQSLLIHLFKIQDHLPRVVLHEVTQNCDADCKLKQLLVRLTDLANDNNWLTKTSLVDA